MAGDAVGNTGGDTIRGIPAERALELAASTANTMPGGLVSRYPR
eukprot:CAMPEP_0175986940 /NCGR_PEP_ID=MMETSP0108-20121206/50424_1 /TAXON_ID=195067 ORGANISM="Goniomonas pacifica, Strain CCMP1869" /NCGR_SAMPLE_ID=MMETSP0108 /ASSEMBLY_ACC=CAM_ASM_000204 /LENGTH=43 /DNA_ID= /DNA_START= /DNA_END= /DNA_ORIENTATION=